MRTTFSDAPNDPHNADSIYDPESTKKYEYRVTYDAKNRPGTLSQVVNVLNEQNLQIRRMFVGSAELQASPQAVDKRGIFKIVSLGKGIDTQTLKNEIENAIFDHYRKYFPSEANRENIKVTVTRINTTARIHFAAQFVSLDKPGVVEGILAEIRATKVLNSDLGLISFILIPLYERYDTDGPISFIDVRGFIDNPYIYETLTDSGLRETSAKLTSSLHQNFLSGRQEHFKWSIQTTNPRCEAMTGKSRIQKDQINEVRAIRNFRVIFKNVPNVPGTAWAVARSLNSNNYNIRRAFIGEINVANYSLEDRSTSRARFNVNPTYTSETFYPDSEDERDAIKNFVSNAVASHFTQTFSTEGEAVKIPEVEVKDAVYEDKYYFGVQVRLSGDGLSNVTVSDFIAKVASLFFDLDGGHEWIDSFAHLNATPKPYINIERAVLLVDYTGALHENTSHKSDTLVEFRISVEQHWKNKNSMFRLEFAEAFCNWLIQRMERLDDTVNFVGVKSISPGIDEIFKSLPPQTIEDIFEQE